MKKVLMLFLIWFDRTFFSHVHEFHGKDHVKHYRCDGLRMGVVHPDGNVEIAGYWTIVHHLDTSGKVISRTRLRDDWGKEGQIVIGQSAVAEAYLKSRLSCNA